MMTAIMASQTTQGLIAGRLLDARTGIPIAGARITCSEEATSTQADALSDDDGFYALPLLPPGQYSIRATAAAYQSQEIQEQELLVAGRLDVNFLLRPLNDVWEAGMYRSVFLPGTKTVVTFYGPDVDATHSGNFEGLRGQQGTLEATLSDVIDPLELENLPLDDRDAYALLFTLPAVTSDGNVSRGLGIAVNGQRPSSSNYLLDGVENNNYLITGPLTPVAPEAIQEYRISLCCFSAQYGRTAGFIANAVTRSGTSQWHGVGYAYFSNEILDGNTFQRNSNSCATATPPCPQPLGRPFHRELRPGFQVGGPLLGKRLFVSGAFEQYAGRWRQDPQPYWLPTPALAAALPAGGVAAKLLTQYPTPFQGASSGPCTLSTQTGCDVEVLLQPPVSVNQSTGLMRLDYISPDGAHRVFGRASVMGLNAPDFLWSTYKDFVSAFHQTDISAVASDQYAITPRLTNEARAAYSVDDVGWGGSKPGMPNLQVTVAEGAGLLQLPGSSPVYPFQNNNHNTELLDNLVWTRGRHVVTVGAGVLLRNLEGFYAAEGNGTYTFNNLTNFGKGIPSALLTSIDRSAVVQNAEGFFGPVTPSVPDYNNQYVNRQYFLFAQESFRATSRLLLNYGLRYEYDGAPHSVGPNRNAIVELGAGSNVLDRLQTATLNFAGGSAGQLYQPDNSDFAPRVGFSYDVWSGKTVLHGGYGIFYDRPFDNLWETVRTNNLDFAEILFRGAAVNFSQPIAQMIPTYATKFTTIATSVPNLTLFQPNLKNGYAQDIFLGIQQRVTEALGFEINGMAALGRRLITVDTLGRGDEWNGSTGIPTVQLFTYRGSQGLSDYYALTMKARYRLGRSLFQADYTWSHAIDNQSDPLGLDLSNFGFPSNNPPESLIAGFAQPMNSNGDRGSADFDQRHNLNLLSTFDLPSFHAGRLLPILSHGWTISEVVAFRSGFPYTVWALTPTGYFARADITDPALTMANEPVSGGVQLLNPAGFSGTVGEPSGRNAFTGPGMFNGDVSVSRSFSIRGLPESSRLVFRADLYNALNHANLNNPYPVIGTAAFGVATYGLTGISNGFPTPLPLAETPRQIQLSVRLRF
jgi:hypothetical protein